MYLVGATQAPSKQVPPLVSQSVSDTKYSSKQANTISPSQPVRNPPTSGTILAMSSSHRESGTSERIHLPVLDRSEE
jgi:hypothetical protein